MSLKSESSDAKVTLSILTKFVRSYDGNRETLAAFLTNCDNAISLAAPDQQNILCKYIISQLEGKAQLACSLKNFNNWDELKSYLKSTFGEKKHSSHLLLDLQNCKQGQSESVTQYSIRLEACLTRLQADIQNSCTDRNLLLGKITAMEELALSLFQLGLNPNISNIVRCRNPSTLNEAISLAVEEEKIFKLVKITQPKHPTKFCSLCKKTNHSFSECFKKKHDFTQRSSFHIPPANPQYSAETSQSSSKDSNFVKTCAYCKHKGHLISECRKRQYNNNQRRMNSHPPSGPSHSNSANVNMYEYSESLNEVTNSYVPESKNLN